MDWVIILALVAVLFVISFKLLRIRQFHNELNTALEMRRPLLRENVGYNLNSRVTEKVNQLIVENEILKRSTESRLDQFQSALANMLEGALILDEDNRIISTNKTFSAFAESWKPGMKIAGQSLETVIPNPELSKVVKRIRNKQAESPKTINVSFNEQECWIRVSGGLIQSDDPDSPKHTLLFLTDVSRQKKLETVRTEFVANVSHELRTPVTILKGYCDTLVEDFEVMPEASKLKFIRKLGKNVDRMNDLLADLLSLSEIEASTSKTKMSLVSLNAIIRQVVADHFDRFEEKLLKIEVELDESIPKIPGDLSKLVQVFENLFGNAIKYVPENHSVSVGTQLGKETVLAWVQDDGPGIPASDLPRIFERFYRVEKGRSREKGGTGLGLSIVKRIVAMHDGGIKAMQAKGGGLRIEFTLPLHKEK